MWIETKYQKGDKVYVNWSKSKDNEDIFLPCFVEILRQHKRNHIQYYACLIGKMYVNFKEEWIDSGKGFMMNLNKPKFKVGDRVKIDWGTFEIKNPHLFQDWNKRSGHKLLKEAIVTNVFDEFKKCHIDLDFINVGMEYKYLTLIESKPKCNIEVDDSSISEHKPKWSVSTYVEMLTDFTDTDRKFHKDFVFKIDSDDGTGGVRYIEDGGYYFTVYELNLYEKEGKIKWHENKPESKHEFVLHSETCLMPPQNENNIKLPKPLSFYDGKDLIPYSADEVGRCDIGIRELWSEQRLKHELELTDKERKKKRDYLIEFTNKVYAQYLYNYKANKLLQKPTITISKQKSINININKPII